MLRVEDVGRGRVVDNDGVLEVAADLRQVLDVVALVVVATLAEEAMVHHLVDIQLVEERIAILRTVLGRFIRVAVSSRACFNLPWTRTQ